jgi:hypothetical protein
MKKYILVGYIPVTYFNQEFPQYAAIAQSISDGIGDIYEISSLDGLSELLQQLVGWNAFVVISKNDVIEIKKHLEQ